MSEEEYQHASLPEGEEDKASGDDEQSVVLVGSADVWREFLTSEAVQSFISGINDLISERMQLRASSSRGITRWALSWSGILVISIVGAVAVLAWFNKISADAATFVFGTVVGAAFTFLRMFFGPDE